MGVSAETNAHAELSASERAYAWTRLRILDGRLAGGSMISESEISDSLGISRTPVREAFLRLAAEGILKLFPKRGALIIPVTAEDVRDVMEARLLVEPWAVAIAAGHKRRQPLASTLSEQLQTIEQAFTAGMILEFQEADRSFHEAIVATTENRIVDVFYRSLRDRQLRMGATALIDNEERAVSILKEHREIAEAIAAGDVDGAVGLVRAHIEHTRDVLNVRLR